MGLVNAVILLNLIGQLGTPAVSTTSVRWKSRKELHPEWVKMAQKQLKGADPKEKLTWHTPEVTFTGTFHMVAQVDNVL